MFLLQSQLPTPLPLTVGTPWQLAAEQYWAVMVWLVLPAIAGIWAVHLRRDEGLRKTRRHLRRLEAHSPASVRRTALIPKPTPTPVIPTSRRASALTAKILVAPVSTGTVPELASGATQPI